MTLKGLKGRNEGDEVRLGLMLGRSGSRVKKEMLVRIDKICYRKCKW